MALSGARGPAKTWREAALRRIFDSGDTLRLQFPREDVGFVYSAGALCADDPQLAAAAAKAAAATGARGAEFVPSTAPGARLPHVPLTLLTPGGADAAAAAGEQPASTIDVVAALPADRLLLVLTAGGPAASWREAAALAAGRGARLRLLRIAPAGGAAADAAAEPGAGGGEDLLAADAEGRWPALRQVSAGGALLVRPDGHVAWRAAGPPASAAAGADALLRAQAAVFSAAP
jgi:2,4-dichlorophenol 6-monooxygenase